MEWRTDLAAIQRGDKGAIRRFRGGSFDPDTGEEWSEAQGARYVAEMVLHDEAEALADDDRAKLLSVAQGFATPLLTHLDAWLAEPGAKGPLRGRTVFQYRSDLATLSSWLAKEHLPQTIEAVTKPVAGRYVSASLAAGNKPKTVNRHVSAASAYWRWLVRRTDLPTNPWTGQTVGTVTAPGTLTAKRAVTDDELWRLLNPPTTLLTPSKRRTLVDAVTLAALTGARLEELFRLRVADCGDGWLRVRDGKSRAAIRRIPVHPGLAELLARRCARKGPGDYLIDEEGGDPPHGRERSMPFSKRFGTYRRALGVDERVAGQRSSRVEFHSLRRWVIDVMLHAGVVLAVVQQIVGHEREDITNRVYSGGASHAQLEAAIRTIALPLGPSNAR